MKPINLETAEQPELLEYARSLGLTVTSRYSSPKLRGMIVEHQGSKNAEAVDSIDAPEPEFDQNAFLHQKVKVSIHKTDSDTGSLMVPVGVNGKIWLFKRGETVEVPRFVVEVLQNAIKDIYIFEDSTGDVLKRSVSAYPHTVNGIGM